MSISHDLRLKTALPYTQVEQMLSTACSKRYSMTLDGIEETDSGPRKIIRIAFEDAGDRERFRKSFKQSREEMPAPTMPPPRGFPERRRTVSTR